MDPLVRNACYRIVTGLCRETRHNIWNMPQPDAATQTGNIVALAQGLAADVVRFTLPGGQRLGDAKRDEWPRRLNSYTRRPKTWATKADGCGSLHSP